MSAQLTAKEIKNSLRGEVVLRHPPKSTGMGTYKAQLAINTATDNIDIFGYLFGRSEDDAHNKCVMTKTAINETYGKDLDPAKYEECVKALELLISKYAVFADKRGFDGVSLKSGKDALKSARIK